MNSISLLVPCYNAEKYILIFLKNLSTLTKKFDEILFYDDCSTDNTVEILALNNQKVITGDTNNGPGFARNILAVNATCKYIHFHDIDDEFTPEFLSLINFKLSEKEYDVIIGYADWIDQTTRKTQILWKYDIDAINQDKLAYFISHPLGIISTIYKKSTFQKTGGFNQKIRCWEDSDLHVKLAALDANFGVINKVLAYSIRHNNGISQNQDKCWQCRLNFLVEYLKLYPKYANVIAKQIGNTVVQLVILDNYEHANSGITQLKKINQLIQLSPNRVIRILIKLGFPPLIILIFRKKIIGILSYLKVND